MTFELGSHVCPYPRKSVNACDTVTNYVYVDHLWSVTSHDTRWSLTPFELESQVCPISIPFCPSATKIHQSMCAIRIHQSMWKQWAILLELTFFSTQYRIHKTHGAHFKAPFFPNSWGNKVYHSSWDHKVWYFLWLKFAVLTSDDIVTYHPPTYTPPPPCWSSLSPVKSLDQVWIRTTELSQVFIGRILARFIQMKKIQKVWWFYYYGMGPRIDISYCCQVTSCTGRLRSQDSLYRVKFKSCFNVAKTYTNRFLSL